MPHWQSINSYIYLFISFYCLFTILKHKACLKESHKLCKVYNNKKTKAKETKNASQCPYSAKGYNINDGNQRRITEMRF